MFYTTLQNPTLSTLYTEMPQSLDDMSTQKMMM
jgi:hypothetical protein